jgi:hypothetical protein
MDYKWHQRTCLFVVVDTDCMSMYFKLKDSGYGYCERGAHKPQDCRIY